MKQPVEISIVLPVRNGMAHLQEALDSLYRQTFRDFELLVVDDCSEDATPDLLARQRDSRLRVLRNETRGFLVGCLNRGLAEARGRWVARMDADDVAHPRRLERQLWALRQHPDSGIIGCAVRRFGGSPRGRLAYPVRPAQVRAFALFNCPFAHPAVLFDRRRFADAGLRYDDDFFLSEDYELWLRALELMEGRNLPDTLLDYRMHGASVTALSRGAMDRQAARVQARLLRALGLPSDEASARWHRTVAIAQPAASLADLQRMGDWLERLRDANRAHPWCEGDAYDEAADDVWYRCCMAATQWGREVPRLYLAGARVRGLHQAWRAAKLQASTLRRHRSEP